MGRGTRSARYTLPQQSKVKYPSQPPETGFVSAMPANGGNLNLLFACTRPLTLLPDLALTVEFQTCLLTKVLADPAYAKKRITDLSAISVQALLDRALRLDVDAAARQDPCLDDDLQAATGQRAAPGTPSSFVAPARSPSPLDIPSMAPSIGGGAAGEYEEEEEEEEDSITPPRTPASGAGSSDGLYVQTAFDPFSARGGAGGPGRIAAGGSVIASEIGSEDISASAGAGGGGDSVEEDVDFPGSDSGTMSAAAIAGAEARRRPGAIDASGGTGIASASIRTDGGGGYSDTFEHLAGGDGRSSSVPEDVATSSLEEHARIKGGGTSAAGTVSTGGGSSLSGGVDGAAGGAQVQPYSHLASKFQGLS